jgi:hypothetical protein
MYLGTLLTSLWKHFYALGAASARVFSTQRTVALDRAAVGLKHRLRMGSDGVNTDDASLKARITTLAAFTNRTCSKGAVGGVNKKCEKRSAHWAHWMGFCGHA